MIAADNVRPRITSRGPGRFQLGILPGRSETGTTSATGLPCLKTTTTSPFSTLDKRADARDLNSVKLTVVIAAPSVLYINVQ
jgi:hypothetical protein